MPRREKPDYAGLRSWTRARSTGVFVGVYDGEEAGFDTEAGRWQTVCETHDAIISHRTLALARRFAPVPEEWCQGCQAIIEERPVPEDSWTGREVAIPDSSIRSPA